jgi:hypothetical protein
MRVHRGIAVLATALTMAGTSTPAANAFIRVGSRSSSGQPATATHPRSGESIDWVIGIGTAAGITLLGTGLVATRRRTRPVAHRSSRPAA